MSRKNFHEEDWDRQRAYLLRNLFQEDLQQLSTITEEDGSNDSTLNTEPLISVAVKKSKDLPEHTYSPLPPLIIEKEPNKHDEPEEHYLKLEKRIMKVYRKMFCSDYPDAVEESDSDISDRSIQSSKYCERRASFGEANNEYELIDEDNVNVANHSIDNDLRTKKVEEPKIKLNEPDDQHNDRITEATDSSSSTEVFPKSTTDCDRQSDVTQDVDSDSTNPSEHIFRDIEMCENNKEKEKTNDEVRSSLSDIAAHENTLETDTSSLVTCDVGYRQITTTADVHRSASEEIIQKLPSPIYEQKRSSSSSDESQQELEENYVSANNLSKNSSERDKPHDVEVMRAARLCSDSVGSLRNTIADESPRNQNREKESTKRHLEPEIGSESSEKSNINEMDYEDFINNDVLLTTLSNVVLHNENVSSKNTTRKRKTSASQSPSTNKLRKVNIRVQTSLDKRIVGDNLIAKIHRVYNLCSCVNHKCQS